MERKEIGQIQGRISNRRLVCSPTILHVSINLYTKYDFYSSQGCGEIFYEKCYGITEGRRDGMTDRCIPVYFFQSGRINRTNTGKNEQEKAGSQSTDTIHQY